MSPRTSLLYFSEPSSLSPPTSAPPSPKPRTRKLKRSSHSRNSNDSGYIPALSPNQEASTRPSPAAWADGPYRLIPTPRCTKMNGAVYCATEMANGHNMILRGLNSILRQAPYVSDAARPCYVEEDVRDFLFFVQAWAKTLDHHHHIEETVFFPAVEEMTGVVGMMDDLQVEHEEFHDGLVVLKKYAQRMVDRPREYRWQTMKKMIYAFAPFLVNHLYSEVDFLLHMDMFDSEGLKRCWLESEKVATKMDDSSLLYDVFPLTLGNCDRTYEGGSNSPELPKALRIATRLLFSKKHHGAWRFNSCDFLGRPMPLPMLPENRV